VVSLLEEIKHHKLQPTVSLFKPTLNGLGPFYYETKRWKNYVSYFIKNCRYCSIYLKKNVIICCFNEQALGDLCIMHHSAVVSEQEGPGFEPGGVLPVFGLILLSVTSGTGKRNWSSPGCTAAAHCS